MHPSINNLFCTDQILIMTQQNRYEKTYNCSCGAAFNTLKELDKHNHEFKK